MRKIVLLIILVSLYQCEKDITTLPGWTKIFEGPYIFSSVFFPSSDTGYVAGTIMDPGYYSVETAVVIKTVDGGSTWEKLTLPEEVMRTISSVYFTDANIGYIVGYSLDYNSIMLKTIDGGATWMILNISNDGSNRISSVYFTDANNGYAVGAEGVIFKTIDGGNTWTSIDLPIETVDRLGSLYFIDSNTGYGLGSREPPYSFNKYYKIILKTNDGGNTWSSSKALMGYGSLRSVFFSDANTGYAVGYDGTVDYHHGVIYKTIDGGVTWTVNWSNALEKSPPISSVYFVDSYTGYATGSNQLLKTINGGTSWTIFDLAEGLSLSSVYFTSTTTGYLVGSDGPQNGIIFKTETGGK